MINQRLCGLLIAVVVLCACSGPGAFATPDRPADLHGIILGVQPHDASTGILEIAPVAVDREAPSVRRVAVVKGTLILTVGSTHPATFDQLQPTQQVRVWAADAAASADQPLAAVVIEIGGAPRADG